VGGGRPSVEGEFSFFEALPAAPAQLDSVLVMRDVLITKQPVERSDLTIDRTLAPRAPRGQTDTD